MWQRFTERTRRAIFFAQEEAAKLGQNYVGTEHLLMGLVREDDSIAAKVLVRLGAKLPQVREAIKAHVATGHGRLGDEMQLTPAAKSAIDRAYEEARNLSNNYIGTEHLLLGLFGDNNGGAGRTLASLGLTLEGARQEVARMQDGGKGGNAPTVALDPEAMAIVDIAGNAAREQTREAATPDDLLRALVSRDEAAVRRTLESMGLRVERTDAGASRSGAESAPAASAGGEVAPARETLPRIGFIGLGIMGRPMALNLLKAGFQVTAWNRSQARLDAVVAAGAVAAPSPAEVAARSDVILAIVTNSPDVEQVVLGPSGVIEGAQPGSVVIDMSTISPQVTRDIAARLAEKGIEMLDAPVSGGEQGAIAGTLSIMAGGKTEVFERCRPVFEAMGKRIVHVGPIGMGQTTKLCNQIVVGLNLLAACEGLAFGAKMGLDLRKMVEAVGAGAGTSWAILNLAPKIIERDFAPGFMIKLQQKDLRLALDAAGAGDLPLPGTALVHELFRATQADGLGDQGTQALITALERLGSLRVSG